MVSGAIDRSMPHADASRELLDEEPDEQRDVVGALAQRRQRAPGRR